MAIIIKYNIQNWYIFKHFVSLLYRAKWSFRHYFAAYTNTTLFNNLNDKVQII